MQNVTENLKEGIVDLLNTVPVEELSNLAALVTGGLSKTLSDRKEITNVILLHSPSVRSVLLRRAITRNRLYEYLTSKSVSLNAQTTKESLIEAVLGYWDSTAVKDARAVVPSATDATETPAEPSRIDEMAVKFVEWFYEMFNSDSDVAESHFWADASVELDLVSRDRECVSERVDGDSAEVVRLLADVKAKYRIRLNPNVCRDGVRGLIDKYGLVSISACGTVHSDSCCVGVFEQTFALGTDPSVENNWKIKRTRLRLLNATVSERPTLGNSPIEAIVSQRSLQN